METLLKIEERNEVDEFMRVLQQLALTEKDKEKLVSYAQGMLSMKESIKTAG